MDKVSEMGEAPLGRLLLRFSLPSIAIMLVNSLYNFIDRIFIGQGMGTDALAAVTAGFPMMLVAEGIGTMLNVGAATLISVAMGAGRREEAKSALGQAFVMAILVSIPVMASSWILMDPLLRLFGTTAEIMPLARTYIGIVTLGFVFQIVSMAVANSLRAQNRPRSAMFATVSGTALNAVLAPLFIFVFKWGIAGAAWATVLAQAFSCILTLAYIQGKGSVLRIEKGSLGLRAATVGKMLKLGLPLLLVHLLALAMLLVANNAMAAFGGATALAAIGIINTLANLLGFPIMGITQGAGALWGYNYGAGKIDRVKRLSLIVAIATSAIGLIATATIELFPRAFISVFNGSDPELIAIGSRGIAIFLLSFFSYGIQATAASLFMSIGEAARGGILYILRQVLAIAAMLVLPRYLGIDGIYWAGPATDAVCTAVSALALALGLRKMKAPLAAASAEAGAGPGKLAESPAALA
jgi:putative MATE family efflux protein